MKIKFLYLYRRQEKALRLKYYRQPIKIQLKPTSNLHNVLTRRSQSRENEDESLQAHAYTT